MTFTIPFWVLYALGAIGLLIVLFLAFIGVMFLIAFKDFKINW